MQPSTPSKRITFRISCQSSGTANRRRYTPVGLSSVTNGGSSGKGYFQFV